MGSRFPGQPLGLQTPAEPTTKPTRLGHPGPEPGAETDEPVAEQAGGPLLGVREIRVVLILPAGLVSAVGQAWQVLLLRGA